MSRAQAHAVPALPRLVTDEIQDRFERYCARHPEVYKRLVAMARHLKAQGKTRYSADALLHVLRFEHDLKPSGEPWVVNNSYSSRFARKIMQQEPDLSGFFEVRALASERAA